MDFYVAVATVSPILLIALSSFYRGRVGHVSTLGSGALLLFAVAPAFVAMLGSLISLNRQRIGDELRTSVLFAICIQVAASLFAIGASMFLSDPPSA